MKVRKGYVFKRGKKYSACWYVGGQKFVKSTGQTERKDAERILADYIKPFLVEDEVRTLETVKARIEGAKSELATLESDRNPPLTIQQAWLAFLAARNRRDTGKATLKQYAVQFDRFRRWAEERMPPIIYMCDVTQKDADDFADHLLSKGRSSGTFNKYLNLLSMLWRILGDKAKTTSNPWETINRKTVIPQGRRELTLDELKNVCQSAEGDLRLLFALGIYCGLRLGDCSTLRWCEVDLGRNYIKRIPNKTAKKQKPVIIPMHPVLRAMIEEIPPSERAEYVLPRIAADYKRHVSYVTDRVQAHFKKCNIRTHRDEKEGRIKSAVEVGFHSLRHSFVSLCRESNAPLSVVEAIVGHSNPAMTRHYTHVSELAASQAVSALPALIGVQAIEDPKPAAMMVDARPIRELVDKLSVKNWATIKEALIALLPA